MKRRNFLSGLVAAVTAAMAAPFAARAVEFDDADWKAIAAKINAMANAPPKNGEEAFERWTPEGTSYVFLPSAVYTLREKTEGGETRFTAVEETWNAGDDHYKAVHYLRYENPLSWEKDPYHVIYEVMFNASKGLGKESLEHRAKLARVGMNKMGPCIKLSMDQCNRFLAS